MSWNLSYQSRAAFDLDAPTYPLALNGEVPSETIEQVDAARHAALALIASGAVVGDDQEFSITLSGHANPDHKPKEGWANDCITVSIYQQSQRSADG